MSDETGVRREVQSSAAAADNQTRNLSPSDGYSPEVPPWNREDALKPAAAQQVQIGLRSSL
jgi:hypothetical protein